MALQVQTCLKRYGLLGLLLLGLGVWAFPTTAYAQSDMVQPTDHATLRWGEPKPRVEDGVIVPNMRLVTPDLSVEAAALDAPLITIWHGDNSSFGQHGEPSPFVNIVGNVQPAGQILSLIYSLNGGPFVSLAIGPQPAAPPDGPRRVYDAGDFNIEIPYTQLLSGANTVVIQATDFGSATSSRTVNFSVNKTNIWPLPAAVDWSAAQSVNDVAQVIDGHWAVEGDTVRSIQFGYDRLIGLGDVTWADYEVTVPVVLNALPSRTYPPGDPRGELNYAYTSPSNGPGVGIILRWPGHFSEGGEQPGVGWTSLGALGWFRYDFSDAETLLGAMELITTQNGFIERRQPGYPADRQVMGTGQPYFFKMQVLTSGGIPIYRIKAWPQAQAEPSGWDIDTNSDTNNNVPPLTGNTPPTGSLLLVAHHVDASFGTVLVTPIDYQAQLTVTSGVGGSASPTTGQHDFYESVTVTATPVDGYSFAGWSGDIVTDTNPLTFRMMGDTQLTASFTETAHSIATEVVGEGEISLEPEKVGYELGEVVTVTAEPAQGWQFIRWEGALSGEDSPSALTVTGDAEVIAVFAQEFYTVTAMLVNTDGITVTNAGRVNIEPPQGEFGYFFNESVVVGAEPAVGWDFVRWEGPVSGTAIAAAFAVTESTTVRAVFTPKQYSLITEAEGQGLVITNPQGSVFDYDSVVELSAVPAAGWIFEQWVGDVGSASATDSSISVVMDRDRVLLAFFREGPKIVSQIYLPLAKP